MSFIDTVKSWATNNLPLIFGLLRTFAPILQIKDFTLVTRFDDVQEVLSRPNVFGVTYAEKMGVVTNGGNFFLGMNDTATYARDVSNMRILIRREDVDASIIPLVKRLSEDIIRSNNGKMDVVKELSGPVAARFVRDYIGIPGPSEAELIDWTTYQFQYLFFPDNPKEDDDKAVGYAKLTREYLDALIQKRKLQEKQPDDVISRCFALQRSGTPGMTDIDIRNNLIGIIIGAIPTTSKAVALVINYLLNHPHLLAGAQEAARNDDMAAIRQYVLEVLRFDSFGAGVFRIANEDYTLAAGTLHSKKIRKGGKVLASTQSAMLDGRQIDKPKQFRLNRPLYHYMHFGYGMHQCFGYYINLVQIPIIVMALLKCKGLRRNPAAPEMRFRGPFPSSLEVEFDTKQPAE